MKMDHVLRGRPRRKVKKEKETIYGQRLEEKVGKRIQL